MFWRRRSNEIAEGFAVLQTLLRGWLGSPEDKARADRELRQRLQDQSERFTLSKEQSDSIIDRIDRSREAGDLEAAQFLTEAYFGPCEPVGPVANNIGPERAERIRAALDLKAGDATFFVAGDPDKFAKFAGLARTKVGQDLKLIEEDRFDFCWIVDFPMYEWNEDEKKIDFSHNPFSMPQGGLEALTTQDPLTIKAYQYDIVCNGIELSSGAIRNHRPDVMLKAFEIAGYGADVLEQRFGGLYRAFQCGAPPHGGIAPGIDRIVMLLAGEENLREVVLFPMNQRAEDLLMGAPSPATAKQLRELSIRVVAPDK
ncbi:MAG TPA: amino acid--tRNA ligase-related protein [Roseiarcus sp.]|nr:amino acid--tRNA ligase-related protein [Roseiarcus sp.]